MEALTEYRDLIAKCTSVQESPHQITTFAKNPITEPDISKQVETVPIPMLPKKNSSTAWKVTKIVASAGALLALTILQNR